MKDFNNDFQKQYEEIMNLQNSSDLNCSQEFVKAFSKVDEFKKELSKIESLDNADIDTLENYFKDIKKAKLDTVQLGRSKIKFSGKVAEIKDNLEKSKSYDLEPISHYIVDLNKHRDNLLSLTSRNLNLKLEIDRLKIDKAILEKIDEILKITLELSQKSSLEFMLGGNE